MTNKWNYQPPTQEQILRKTELSEAFGLSPAVCLLMVQRGIATEEDCQQFLNPGLRDLHDPFLYPDMGKAIDRLNQALGNKERILIYGDYDVDGTTAVALVYKFLEQNTWASNLDYYIPDRYDEGYGISEKGIAYAQETGVRLIIALDCGIKAIEKVAYAKSLGIDFIICDHHMPGEVLPNAVAILDAKREDSRYPYEHLSGCGVGFKFMQAFAISNDIDFSRLRLLLDFVAVSIASDIVPITGENRVMAAYGLKQLNHNPSKGLKGIIDICGLFGKEITISDIVFKIGPRINASGRMMNGKEAVDLLLAKDFESAKEKSENIDQYNDDRRELDKKITDEAYTLIDENPLIAKDKIIVVYNPEWHKGVIGIVASRLTEKYYKPAIVLTESNGYISGSARSITGFDIYKAIESCKDVLVNFGGHTFAAGITLKEESLDLFKFRLESFADEYMIAEQMIQTLDIDMALKFSEINQTFFNDLKRLNPFGPDNQKPVFCSFGVRDSGTSKLVGRELEHIKLDLTDDSSEEVMQAIAFGMHESNDYIKSGKPFDVCYTIEENTYNNKTSIQLLIKDIRISE
ncbi:single-stranded-DNA-specific exonuclease RecJ [Bacteroidia bacterium]|nr:single-stranded-DNA-specific exonuclease RecJ [Bacteroidia bacterium]GHT27167.1 single-stranded-DNA-specific exonuclease RecJ [Bacteroidia bacterium]